MKKKIKCVIRFLISAFILGGCTGKQNVQESSQLYDETVRGDGYIVVGFSQVGSESDWRIGNTESLYLQKKTAITCCLRTVSRNRKTS